MALKRIVLRDFVIVAELELEFDAGFSVLTGETGAGKSILVDALQLATGGRADLGAIREGAARAEVSAEFDLSAASQRWLLECGFEASADSLLLRRVVDAQGKNRAWINGSPCTVGQLRELGEQLLDIHGQHAWQSLTRPASVRALLDAYGEIDTSNMQAAWTEWRTAQAALASALASQDSLQSELERLQWQVGEVDKLAPTEHEWPELNAEHSRLAHAQALIEAAQAALGSLGEGSEGGALASLAHAQRHLQEQARIEPEFNSFAGPTPIQSAWTNWINASPPGCPWRGATVGRQRNCLRHGFTGKKSWHCLAPAVTWVPCAPRWMRRSRDIQRVP
ncbi:MAG: putative repair ATPase [Pseudomonadota bacterium]|jgi:DNA repair protein RecN (Recombination protein N)